MADEKQKLKEKLDTIYSQYIRLRDSDENGYCKCITCEYSGYWEKDKIQNGHYIRRDILATRFDDDNCNAQCENCNLWKHKGDMQLEYRRALVEIKGEELVARLEQLRYTTTILSTLWYANKISFYQQRIAELKASKGL